MSEEKKEKITKEEKLAVGLNDDWSVRYMTRGELMGKYPKLYKEGMELATLTNKDD